MWGGHAQLAGPVGRSCLGRVLVSQAMAPFHVRSKHRKTSHFFAIAMLTLNGGGVGGGMLTAAFGLLLSPLPHIDAFAPPTLVSPSLPSWNARENAQGEGILASHLMNGRRRRRQARRRYVGIHAAPNNREDGGEKAIGVGLYVHIPYCRRRCRYCDFAIVPIGSAASDSSSQKKANDGFHKMDDAYRSALLMELDLIRQTSSSTEGDKIPLRSIYFGEEHHLWHPHRHCVPSYRPSSIVMMDHFAFQRMAMELKSPLKWIREPSQKTSCGSFEMLASTEYVWEFSRSTMPSWNPFRESIGGKMYWRVLP